MLSAGLKFSATNDAVYIPDTPALTDNSIFTFGCLVSNVDYTSTAPADRRFFTKGRLATGGFKLLSKNSTTGNLAFTVRRATTNANYVSNNTPIANNVPYFLVVTFDLSATPCGHIYVGTESLLLTEVSYGTNTDGSGALSAEAVGENFYMGNFQGLGPPLLCNMHFAFFTPNVLDLVELNDIRLRPISSPIRGELFRGYFGKDGTLKVLDRSGNGNHAVVSGPLSSAFNLPAIEFGKIL